jgi:hypothetical protein
MRKPAWVLLLAALPAWLSGTWRMTDSKMVSEEIWSASSGTLMTGMHRDVFASGKKTWFEFLRIEQRGDDLVYVAMPGGSPPTEFRATSVGESRIAFENPEHDFPKKIEYYRDGPRLCATVSGGDQAETYCWDRAD